MLRDSRSGRAPGAGGRADDAREQVVEAARGALAVGVEDEGVDLLAEVRDVGAEREHVLDRAVVQVEADAHEPLLAGGDERLLPVGRPLEQELALEDRGERRGRHREVRVARPSARGARDDDGARRRESPNERGASVRLPSSVSPPRRRAARAVARASSALGTLPDRDERLDARPRPSRATPHSRRRVGRGAGSGSRTRRPAAARRGAGSSTRCDRGRTSPLRAARREPRRACRRRFARRSRRARPRPRARRRRSRRRRPSRGGRPRRWRRPR